MATVRDALLEAARHMGAIREGIATGGSTTTLEDTLMNEPAANFAGGTLWMLSGDNDGLCDIVSQYNEGVATIETTLSTAIAAGDEYAIADAEYPKQKLKQAVMAALRFFSSLKTDDTKTVTANTEEYTLPTGVSNVKRVEVATSSSTPYGFVPNYYWKEWNGKLVFVGGKEPTTTGNIIRIWYEEYIGELSETDNIPDSVNLTWLKWAAVAWLYRDQIKRIQKDNPTNLDLLNEAKTLEAEAKLMAKRHQLVSMPSDPKLSGW